MKPDPDSPTVIANHLYEFDALDVMDHLRELGFRPKLWGTLGRWQDGGQPENIQIVVRRSEAEAARIAADVFLSDIGSRRYRRSQS